MEEEKVMSMAEYVADLNDRIERLRKALAQAEDILFDVWNDLREVLKEEK